MNQVLKIFAVVLIIVLTFAQQSMSQVITETGSYQLCRKPSRGIPVVVQNLENVTDFSLILHFDQTVIDYIGFYALHANLDGGDFAIQESDGLLTITWQRESPATIIHDTLVWIEFQGKLGSTALNWNSEQSYYHTATGNLLSLFIDGVANVSPALKIKLTEIGKTCSTECNANVMANVTGGSAPYTYKWNGANGRFDSIQTGLCSGSNLVSITDSWGCRTDSTFDVEGMPAPEVNLVLENNDDTTIYLQNPVLTFSFEEVSPTHIVQPPTWEFGDGDTAVAFKPTHLYAHANTNTDKFYMLKLHLVNENGCKSDLEFKIPIEEAKLRIPNVLTPNGDSFNELFIVMNENKTGIGEEIKVTTEFQSMQLMVFDRWGRKLYEDSNYQNDWHADGLPDGVYYYRLKTVGLYETKIYKGSINVLGSGMSQ